MADGTDHDKGAAARRRYESPIRRERALETRDRILAAGCALAREFPTWDWQGLTVGAVADRAGVNKTTVYRHFPTERDLHDAVLLRLEDESGISYETLGLAELTQVVERIFANLTAFAARPQAPTRPGSPMLGADLRRRDALLRAVTPATSGWTPTQRRMAAAVLDILWSRLSHERLTEVWDLDPDEATSAITWAVDALVSALAEPPPGTTRRDAPEA